MLDLELKKIHFNTKMEKTRFKKDQIWIADKKTANIEYSMF